MSAQKAAVLTARLKDRYLSAIRGELQKQLGLKNVHEVPRLSKISVSVGLGKGKEDKRLFEAATTTLRKIAGQQPIQTHARKSIASFKLREGQPIGLKVTLRGERMYEFIDRLINVVLPRQRDFHGVSSGSFDARGNYTIGLIDQSIFPELSFDETAVSHGLQVTCVISAKESGHARVLLEHLGLPFQKEGV